MNRSALTETRLCSTKKQTITSNKCIIFGVKAFLHPKHFFLMMKAPLVRFFYFLSGKRGVARTGSDKKLCVQIHFKVHLSNRRFKKELLFFIFKEAFLKSCVASPKPT